MSQNHANASENPYASPAIEPSEPLVDLTEDRQTRLLRAFVGSNAKYYLDRWRPLLDGQGGNGGFNWAAMILSGLWLPYRKMYLATLLFYLVILVESVAEELICVGVLGMPETPAVLDRGVGLALGIVCGSFGNRWYLAHARKAIAELTDQGLSDDEVARRLSQRGGTSLGAAIGLFALFLMVLLVIFVGLGMVLYPDEFVIEE